MRKLLNNLLRWFASQLEPVILYTESDVIKSVEAIIKSIERAKNYQQLNNVERAIPILLYDKYLYADYVHYLPIIESALQRKAIFIQTEVVL